MNPQNVLIIGAGTVGTTIGTMVSKAGHHVFYHDPQKGFEAWEKRDYDIIEYTIPQFKDPEDWANIFTNYLLYDFACKYVIIHSSIDPTCLHFLNALPFWDMGGVPKIIYSPIRATEAIMSKQVKQLKKFFAIYTPVSPAQELEILEYFGSVYPQGTHRFHDAEALAFGKLLEVVDFGMQIMFAQQVKMICQMTGYLFEEAYTEYRKESYYGTDYNKLKKGAPEQWIPRGIFTPGIIGGKCVLQDAALLEQSSDTLKPLMKLMRETNDQMKQYIHLKEEPTNETSL